MTGENNADEPIAQQPEVVPPPAPIPPAGVTPPPYVAPPQYAAPTPVDDTVPPPPEDLIRGLLLSLIIVPVGVLVFLLIWNLGFIASIVGFGVALGASFLYRLGSRGRISIRGAFVVTGVTLLTLVLSFIVAEVSWVVTSVSAQTGLSWTEVLSTPRFGDFVIKTLTAPDVIGGVLGDAALTFVFGLLGCFTVLRAAFKEAKGDVPPAVAPPAPQQPPAV